MAEDVWKMRSSRGRSTTMVRIFGLIWLSLLSCSLCSILTRTAHQLISHSQQGWDNHTGNGSNETKQGAASFISPTGQGAVPVAASTNIPLNNASVDAGRIEKGALSPILAPIIIITLNMLDINNKNEFWDMDIINDTLHISNTIHNDTASMVAAILGNNKLSANLDDPTPYPPLITIITTIDNDILNEIKNKINFENFDFYYDILNISTITLIPTSFYDTGILGNDTYDVNLDKEAPFAAFTTTIITIHNDILIEIKNEINFEKNEKIKLFLHTCDTTLYIIMANTSSEGAVNDYFDLFNPILDVSVPYPSITTIITTINNDICNEIKNENNFENFYFYYDIWDRSSIIMGNTISVDAVITGFDLFYVSLDESIPAPAITTIITYKNNDIFDENENGIIVNKNEKYRLSGHTRDISTSVDAGITLFELNNDNLDSLPSVAGGTALDTSIFTDIMINFQNENYFQTGFHYYGYGISARATTLDIEFSAALRRYLANIIYVKGSLLCVLALAVVFTAIAITLGEAYPTASEPNPTKREPTPYPTEPTIYPTLSIPNTPAIAGPTREPSPVYVAPTAYATSDAHNQSPAGHSAAAPTCDGVIKGGLAISTIFSQAASLFAGQQDSVFLSFTLFITLLVCSFKSLLSYLHFLLFKIFESMAASPEIINQLKQIKADSEKKEKTVSDVGTSYWAFDETEMVIPLIKGALFFWIFEILFGIQEITMKKVLTLFNENKPENKKKLTANAVTTYKGDFEKFMVNTNMSPAEVWEWIQNCLQTGNIAFEKEKQILKRVFTLAPGTVEYDRIQQGARNYELKKAQLKAKRKSKTVDETINKAGSLDKFNNCALLLKYAFDHQIDFNKTKMIFELLYDMVEPVSTMVDRKYKYEREITTNDDFVALCNEIEPNLARMEPFNAARIRVEQPIGNNNNNNISPQSIEGSLSSNNNNNNNLDHNINHNEMEMPPSRQPTNKNNNLNDNDSRFTPQGFQLKPITNEHNGQVEGYAIEPKQQNKGKKRKERDEGDTSDSPNKKRKLSPLEQLKQDEKNGVYGTPSGTSAAGKDKTAGGQTGIISQNGETPAGPDIRIDDKSKSHREITRKELETLMTQLINDPKNKKLRNTSKSDEIMKKDMKSLNDLHQNIQFILNKGWQFTTHNLMDANDIIRRLTK